MAKNCCGIEIKEVEVKQDEFCCSDEKNKQTDCCEPSEKDADQCC